MTRFTAKTAEAARKMAAAIMPNAEPEKKNGFVVGLGKSQNRFFADEVSGNSYCEAYADDCETLTHINIFNDCNDVVATIEIDGEQSDTAIDEIRAELGIENNSLKAKVAEILKRPRKKIIDWSGTFEEVRISEILAMQKEMKKFLRLGKIERAENIFAMLKTLCKNYRGVAA